MKRSDTFIRLIRQFIRFGVVGTSNTLIYLLVYYIFIQIDNKFYIMGNIAGFIVSTLNAYYWNNKYVFKKRARGRLKPIFRTFVVYGSTLILSTALLYLWIDIIGISTIIAPMINLLITIPCNFLLIKYWVFNE